MPELTMKIMGWATPNGMLPTPLDGQYVVEYDPTRPSTNPLGLRMRCHLVTSPDRAKARRFPDIAAGHAYWTAESGKPYPQDKPLTAFTVQFDEIND